MRHTSFVLFVLATAACGGGAKHATTPSTKPQPTTGAEQAQPPQAGCGGKDLKVHFYQAGQALAALVELPDGQHILVDTGEDAKRAGCGAACTTAHSHVMSALAADLNGKPIDMIWITHQHSDHVGGAIDVVDTLQVKNYVDNGRDLSAPQIKKTRDEVAAKSIPVTVIEPGATSIPISTGEDVKLSAIVPPQWLSACNTNRNVCSILLRIDYCESSIVFTGDAETVEEDQLDVKPATLIQVGHHGSNTSSSSAFLDKLQPTYAVISSGAKGEGMNKTYCHPFASTVKALNAKTGSAGAKKIFAFDGTVKCKDSSDANWGDVGASDNIWETPRDGDITLTTTGDGKFAAQTTK